MAKDASRCSRHHDVSAPKGLELQSVVEVWGRGVTYGQSAWYGPFWMDGKDVMGMLWIVIVDEERWLCWVDDG